MARHNFKICTKYFYLFIDRSVCNYASVYLYLCIHICSSLSFNCPRLPAPLSLSLSITFHLRPIVYFFPPSLIYSLTAKCYLCERDVWHVIVSTEFLYSSIIPSNKPVTCGINVFNCSI